MLARQSNLIEKLKDENRNYCKEMLNNTKQKKQMIEVKKNMAESQSEIQSIKDKIEKEISPPKQLDLEMIDVQKNFVEKKRVTAQRGTTNKSDAAQYSK